MPSAGCCDAIWLPHIELPNLVGYREDQMPRYRIDANASSGTVTWSTRLAGEWYTPLDFRAYPFDHQHLLMQLAIADSHAPFAGLAWQHVAKLNNTAHTKGADLSGWKVKWGKGKLYDSRACYTSYNVTAPLYSPGSLPVGVSEPAPAAVYNSIRVADRFFANNVDRGSTSPESCGTYGDVYNEGRALYGPMVLVADIMVKRVASYYVLNNLIPVIIISLVTFVVFYMPCNALGDRMVVIMTLFLSLTALQFVFEFPPSNYLNALQQVVLAAYVLMLVAAAESLVVNRIAILPQQLSNTRTCLRKYSKLFRRIHLVPKVSSGVCADKSAVSITNPIGATPRIVLRTASLPRSGSGAKRAGTPTLAAGVGRDNNALSKRVKQPPPSRFGSKTYSEAQPAAAAALGVSLAEAAAVLLGPPAAAAVSVAGSDAGIETPMGREPLAQHPQNSLRINIDSRQPSGSQPSPAAAAAAVHSHCALFDAHQRERQIFMDAAEGCPVKAARPSPPSLGLPPSRVAELLYSCGMSVRLWCLTLVRAPANFYNHCKEDADFAWFIACRIDKWCCLVCLVLYCVCVAVLVWVQTQVGDHKLMLGDRPGNM